MIVADIPDREKVIEAVGGKNIVYHFAGLAEFSHDFMPEYGKGVLWNKAFHKEDVRRLMHQFEEALRLDAFALRVMGEKMRDKYFCEPTEEQFIRAFDLA